MRILVDAIPFDGGKSGISAYTRNVVRALVAEGHEVTVLTEPGVAAEHFPGLPAIEAPAWTRRAVFSMLWHLFLLPRRLKRLRHAFEGFFIAAANRRVCRRYPIPAVATVHDLANFHIPGKYSRLRMFYLAKILPRYAAKANRLVAVSGATADDMARFWGVPRERVTVLYNGACPIPHPEGRPSWAAANGLEPGKYLLYVSRIEHPGKNHVALIDAFAALGRKDLVLVLAGKDWKDAGTVRAHAAASPCADRIRFTGFLADEDLADAYRNAAAYVFPSLFEGFGLSLVEAMAEGTPCACSENGSLGEIAGGVAETFDPRDPAAIASALAKLLDEPPEARKDRLARGRVHAASFTWEKHARGIVNLLESARDDATEMFGIRVARITQAEFAERLVAYAKHPDGRMRLVSTLNVDFVANAVASCGFKGNAELHDILRKADLVTADGMPIVLLAKLLGEPLPERVTGSDLVPDLARRFAEEGLSFYVLGGDEPALSEAIAILKERYPGLRVAGTDPVRVPLADTPENDAIVARINAAKPDLLFVALGNPKQELWASRNAARLQVPAAVGVGGTFNFIAGRVKRAPKWMRRSGLEWVWRFAVEPRRLWKRYAYGFVKFGTLALREMFFEKRRK